MKIFENKGSKTLNKSKNSLLAFGSPASDYCKKFDNFTEMFLFIASLQSFMVIWKLKQILLLWTVYYSESSLLQNMAKNV